MKYRAKIPADTIVFNLAKYFSMSIDPYSVKSWTISKKIVICISTSKYKCTSACHLNETLIYGTGLGDDALSVCNGDQGSQSWDLKKYEITFVLA